MAAVAGAISEYTVKAILRAGATHAIMENGGDIALKIDHPTVVGIYSGTAKINNIGLKFMPAPDIIGICTSSGTIGHSFSFGCPDAATVISKNVLLADAAATVLGNSIKKKEKNQVKKALEFQMDNDIEAMMVIVDDILGMNGKVPLIVKSDVDVGCISKG